MRSDPPGSHEVASRSAAASPKDLGPTDWHFYVVGAFPPDPVIGCGSPVGADQSDTLLDERPAELFIRQGTQNDPKQWIIDVIAQQSGVCTWLQQVTGNAISRDEATGTFAVIQASFQFGP